MTGSIISVRADIRGMVRTSLHLTMDHKVIENIREHTDNLSKFTEMMYRRQLRELERDDDE